MNMRRSVIYLFLTFTISCQNVNQSPICNLTNPTSGFEIEQGETITISAIAEDPDGTISEVIFYIDDVILGTLDSIPYDIIWNTSNEELGIHSIKANAKDNNGDESTDEIGITLVRNLPIVITQQIQNITTSSAVCGGNVSDEGGDIVTARGICWSTNESPTIDNSFTTDGGGPGVFSSSMDDLLPETLYFVRAYATNSLGTGYGQEIEFTTQALEYGSMIDIQGNTYKTTQIGSQIWMAENLRVTRYADGSPIPLVSDRLAWDSLEDNDLDKAYCWYDNDSLSYSQKYGALYTYAAAVNGTPWDGINHVQGVCPDGWHLPSKTEWFILEDYIKNLGYNFDVGTILKAKLGWFNRDGDPEGNGIDVYHFGGLPGGHIDWREQSSFADEGILGKWWCSMESPSSSHTVGLAYGLIYNNPNLGNFFEAKSGGISVRCIKD